MLLSSVFIQKLHKVRSAEPRLTKWQSAAVVLAVGGVLALWLFWTATWPIRAAATIATMPPPF